MVIIGRLGNIALLLRHVGKVDADGQQALGLAAAIHIIERLSEARIRRIGTAVKHLAHSPVVPHLPGKVRIVRRCPAQHAVARLAQGQGVAEALRRRGTEQRKAIISGTVRHLPLHVGIQRVRLARVGEKNVCSLLQQTIGKGTILRRIVPFMACRQGHQQQSKRSDTVKFHNILDVCLLFITLPKLRRRNAGGILEIFAQEALAGKVHVVGNLLHRVRRVAQERLEFHQHETRNPIAGGAAAHVLHHLREVLGRDADLLAVPRHVALAAEVIRKQAHKAVENNVGTVFALFCNIGQARAEQVADIEIESPVEREDKVAQETVPVTVRQAFNQNAVAIEQPFLLRLVEVKHGLFHEEKQIRPKMFQPHDAILRKLLRNEHHLPLEII